MSCIGGDGPGFWRSTNGGVDWTNYNVDPAAPGAYGQQFYAPAVDPYNVNHLLMAVHLSDMIVESMDGGQTWTAINLDPGMLMGGGGVYSISFVDTGTPVMGRSSTWLCIGSEYVAKAVGTWRTTNAGASWTQVETNLHPPGASQIYQQGANGDVYMAGNESTNGDGIFRSTDDGATWTHVGETDTQEKVAFGTSRHLYAMYTGVAALPSTTPVYSPNMQISDTTGLAWTAGTTPAAMAQGPTWAAVTHDGTYNVIVTANYGAGLWRYVEPTN